MMIVDMTCRVGVDTEKLQTDNKWRISNSQVPADVVPSLQQLHDDSPDIHPAIVDCLLFLRGSEEVCS